VVVSSPTGEQSGTLIAAYPDSLIVDTGQPGGVQMIPRPVEVRGQLGTRVAPVGDPRIVWTVNADKAGPQTLEAAYAVTGLTWSVGYSLVLEPKPARRGWLQGWLAVSNHTGSDLRDARAIVVDGKITVPEPVVPPSGPTPSGEVAAVAPAPRVVAPARITPVATRIAVAEGEARQFSLLGEGAQAVPAEVRKVFDPVKRKLDKAAKKPVDGRTYGLVDGDDVHIYVDLDLRAAGITTVLPGGQVRVYERGERGDLIPLGTTRAFTPREPDGDVSATPGASPPATDDRPSSSSPLSLSSGNDVTSHTARLAIGIAPQLTGKRRQTDYSYSADTRRLVEEFRIEIRNRGESRTAVLVREHLYRGLNWALAFHNDVGKIAKTGPQEIEFDVDVPARGKVEIMYRVVYTW
jgi:hypothetical protein